MRTALSCIRTRASRETLSRVCNQLGYLAELVRSSLKVSQTDCERALRVVSEGEERTNGQDIQNDPVTPGPAAPDPARAPVYRKCQHELTLDCLGKSSHLHSHACHGQFAAQYLTHFRDRRGSPAAAHRHQNVPGAPQRISDVGPSPRMADRKSSLRPQLPTLWMRNVNLQRCFYLITNSRRPVCPTDRLGRNRQHKLQCSCTAAVPPKHLLLHYRRL